VEKSISFILESMPRPSNRQIGGRRASGGFIVASPRPWVHGGQRIFQQHTPEDARSNWATLGYKVRDNAEDYREILRGKGVDVAAPDREEWEGPEHGGSFARAAEHPVR
jgi:hypothetical protein